MTFSKDTFSQEVREAIYNSQNGYSLGTLEKIDEFHHRVPNTKANRKRFPLFLQSPFNCSGLSRAEHTNDSHKYKISLQLAQIYEDWLGDFMSKHYEIGLEDGSLR